MRSLPRRAAKAAMRELSLAAAFWRADPSFFKLRHLWKVYGLRREAECWYAAPSVALSDDLKEFFRGFDIQLYDPKASATALADVPFQDREMYSHFRNRGAWAIAIRSETGSIAHLSWVFPEDENKVGTIAWCQTAPECRGRSYYPAALIYARCMLGEHFLSFSIKCATDNVASQHGILKAGFAYQYAKSRTAVLSYLTLRSGLIDFHPPAVEPLTVLRLKRTA